MPSLAQALKFKLNGPDTSLSNSSCPPNFPLTNRQALDSAKAVMDAVNQPPCCGFLRGLGTASQLTAAAEALDRARRQFLESAIARDVFSPTVTEELRSIRAKREGTNEMVTLCVTDAAGGNARNAYFWEVSSLRVPCVVRCCGASALSRPGSLQGSAAHWVYTLPPVPCDR